MQTKELTKGYFQWHARRGMKELDFILNRFIEAHYTKMSQADKICFDQLLGQQDMLLWYWLSKKQQPEDQQTAELVNQICEIAYLKNDTNH